jgi:hypothetical protein
MAYVNKTKVVWSPYPLSPEEVENPEKLHGVRIFSFDSTEKAQDFASLWSS